MKIPDIKDPIPNLPGPEIEDNKLTAWDKLVVGLVFIAIPLALATVTYIAGQREAKIRIPKPTKVYDYQIKQPDLGRFTNKSLPEGVNPKNFNPSSTITLHFNGTTVTTTVEEVLSQLSLDYADLYDYYGGAEELY